MLLRRVTLPVLAMLVVIIGATGCGGGSSDTSSSTTIRPIYGHDAIHCVEGEVVEQNPSYLFHCVARNPALPASAGSDVQQGDPCPTFGATIFNAQGKPFDCEPWADGVNRWILP